MTKFERQRRLLEILSARRFITTRDVAKELGVTRYTVMRDLNELTDSASFYTTPGRNGGIQAMDGWYYSKIYLTKDQEVLLREKFSKLTPDEQQTIQRMLDTFAMPSVQNVRPT